jgi:hypothetical protein
MQGKPDNRVISITARYRFQADKEHGSVVLGEAFSSRQCSRFREWSDFDT